MVYVVLIGLGLLLGSFVNALVWRVHEQESLREKKRPTKADKMRLQQLSISRGRSMCLQCGHGLAPKDLVPVFSWFWLRGKCRYCGAAIPDTPVAELLVPALFIISYVWWPFVLFSWAWFALALWLAAVVLFVALALYDVRWFLLPNRVVFPLIGIAVVYRLVLALQDQARTLDIVMSGLWGVIVLAGLFYVLFRASNEQWIGGGDVKLAVALGLFAGGPLAALLLLFIASVTGTLAGLPMVLRGKPMRQARVPFGPFLLLATFVTVLFSGGVLDWYTGLFLP